MAKPGIRFISPKSQLTIQTPNNPLHMQLCHSHTGQDLHCRLAPDVTSHQWGTANSELSLLPACLPHQFPLPGFHTNFKLFKIWDLPRPLLKAKCVTAWKQFPGIVYFFYRKMSLHCPDLSSAQGSSSRTATVTGDRDFLSQDLPAGSWLNDHSLTLGEPSSHGLIWERTALDGYSFSWTRKKEVTYEKISFQKILQVPACLHFLLRNHLLFHFSPAYSFWLAWLSWCLKL